MSKRTKAAFFLAWIGAPVLAAFSLPTAMDWRNPNWVMNLPAYILAAGAIAPFLYMPIDRLLDRREQRRISRMLMARLKPIASKQGVFVDVEPAGLRSVRLRVSDNDIPDNITIRRERLLGRDIQTGDPKLDPVIRLDGHEATALAMLSPEVREEVRKAFGLEPDLRLRGGVLEVTMPITRTPMAMGAPGPMMIELAQTLALDFSEVSLKLADHARNDPEPAVRKRALEALLKHRPDSPPARALTVEILRGDDPHLGLLVAEILERETDIARFRAMIDGARGRLAVSAEGDAGGLSVASEAPEGALSRPRPKVKS